MNGVTGAENKPALPMAAKSGAGIDCFANNAGQIMGRAIIGQENLAKEAVQNKHLLLCPTAIHFISEKDARNAGSADKLVIRGFCSEMNVSVPIQRCMT